MRFEFATATRIIFGAGTVQEVASHAAGFGRRALLVTGSDPERAASLVAQLEGEEIEVTTYPVAGEPTTTVVLEGVSKAREFEAQVIIGFGGGSALDAGKAIAALANNEGDIYDYLEVIGRGQALIEPPASYIAIPTTAGTGTEVTRNAVLASAEHQVKVSLRSPLMLPRLAIIDPELTYSLPPEVTASTGLDALTQVMEPFVSVFANPLTDAICREGMWRAGRSLRLAYERGDDAVAREDMALTSLFGGLALANAKLGAVHGFAGPIGGMFPAPHGVICARLLPLVMEANVRVLQAQDPGSPALARYDEVAQLLTGNGEARAADGLAWVQSLSQALAIPLLSEYGLLAADFPEIVVKSSKASSMKGNPIVLTEAELTGILVQAI
jgi:alcohol dehydrogenase class IV